LHKDFILEKERGEAQHNEAPPVGGGKEEASCHGKRAADWQADLKGMKFRKGCDRGVPFHWYAGEREIQKLGKRIGSKYIK